MLLSGGMDLFILLATTRLIIGTDRVAPVVSATSRQEYSWRHVYLASQYLFLNKFIYLFVYTAIFLK